DHDRNQQADQKRDRCYAEKTCPPTYRRGGKGERSGRQQRSQRSDPDLQAGERGKAIGRKLSGVDGERSHERACRSHPQQRPAEDQSPGLAAHANTTAPMTVIAAPTTRQIRGPNRSSAMPSGICTAANAKKKTLDKRPISAGERLRSL